MNSVVLGVLGVSAMLVAISVVVPVARRLMLPYTLVLAALGCVIGLLSYLHFADVGLGGQIVSGLREIGLLDDAFIYIFLPPLLFSAGLTVDVRHILEDAGYVILLAFVAVLLCTVFVGYSLDLVSGIGIVPCLLLGTIVSTTDTAAVINIFREAGAPKRLSAIVEGEALFNDAAAIALFGLFLSMITLGKHPDVLDAAREFALALVGGAAFGYFMARVCGWLISFLQDSVTTEVTLTVALTYFTFIVSNEVLGISGVIATVTLATFVGSGSRTRVSPGSWEVLHNVWEHLDFWATSFIFIISAMYIPRALNVFSWADALNVTVVFVAGLASRAIVIGGMMPTFSAIGASKPLQGAYKIVLWWGGMRGAVTVALALATTATDAVPLPVRHLIASTAIGYVIASLVVNGLTLRPVMSFLHLDRFNERDHALRNRMLTLARRRIKKELSEVATLIGHDAEKLSIDVVPAHRTKPAGGESASGLALALETWSNHEFDTILAFRERGLITRHHADALRGQADRLMHALRNGGIEGYAFEAEHVRRSNFQLRMYFTLHRRFGWLTALVMGITARTEYLVAELLLVRDLVDQCASNAGKLFGKDTAHQLKSHLDNRLKATEEELKSIESIFPKFSSAMRHRYLELVALGLVEAEYRRHLSDATISIEVFEDLDGSRRAIASAFTRRFDGSSPLDLGELVKAFPMIDDYPAVRPSLKPYVAFPGQHIGVETKGTPRLYLVIAGQIETRSMGAPVSLGPGDFFATRSYFAGCKAVTHAVSKGYTGLLEVDWFRLKAIMQSEPEFGSRFRHHPQPTEA